MLRAAYDDLAQPLNVCAKAFGTSASSIQIVRDCVADVFIAGQQQKVRTEIRRWGELLDKHTWVCYAIQWDESKFTIESSDGPASDSVMTMHGVVRWMGESLKEHRTEEVVLTPFVLQSSTADWWRRLTVRMPIARCPWPTSSTVDLLYAYEPALMQLSLMPGW